MKSRRWLTAVCIALSTVTAIADEAERVGQLGHPSRLQIVGAQTFSADQIRNALFDDLEVLAACEKDAPLLALTALLAEKTEGGYQSAGFVGVKVTAAHDDRQIRVTIDEHDRYAAGHIVVIGNRLVDEDRLKDTLTRPASPATKRAYWTTGEPASFRSEYWTWMQSQVADRLGDQGFYRSKLKVTVEAEHEAKKGNLRIQIDDEGAQTTLADVEYVGGERNAEPEVLAYLGLDTQAVLTGELRQQIVNRLLASGRYAQVQWKLGKADERDAMWRPRLTVKEYDRAPPLLEPITREEAALLKLAEWVERFDESDEELLIRFADPRVSVVFAPRHGFIMTLDPNQEAGAADDPVNFLGALVIAEERVGLYSLAQRKKIDAAPPPAPIMGNSEVSLVSGSPSWEGRGRLMFGVGMRPARSKASRHVTMHLKLTASAALSVVRTHEAKATWEGDVVCLKWRNRQLRIDSLTGRLLEDLATDEPSDTGKSDGLQSAHITLVSGLFGRRLAEIERTSADWPNVADERRPLSCVGELLCDELKHLDAKSADGYAAIRKLISGNLLQPFDELVVEYCRPKADDFVIPVPYYHFKFTSFEELLSSAQVLARPCGMWLGSRLFPRDGWLNGIWRNGVFLLADGRTPAVDDLSSQPAESRGALCALLSAEILNAMGQGHLSPTCARRGLRRLSTVAFHGDCRELLSGDGFVSRCLLQATGALRQLDAQETKALAELLTRGELLDVPRSAAFESLISLLRTSGADSPAERAGEALDALWRAGLSDFVERRLKELAAPPVPVEAPFAYSPPDALPDVPPTYGGSYRSAVPFEAPGSYPSTNPPAFAEPGEPSQSLPPDDAKSLRDEVRELKWLAQAITERLQKLEDRLQSQAADPAANHPHAGPVIGLSTDPATHVFLEGPASLKFVPNPGEAPVDLPVVVLVERSVSIVLTGLNGHEKEHLTALVEVPPAARAKIASLEEAIPVKLGRTDLEAALSGKSVTYVIHQSEVDGARSFGAVSSEQIDAGKDPVVEASRRGAIVAIVRLGTKLSDMSVHPGGANAIGSSTKSSAPQPASRRVTGGTLFSRSALALDGYCPVTLVQERQWRRGDARFIALHDGKTYRFIDAASQTQFVSDPDRYCPVFHGDDLVLSVDEHQTVAGRREHGVFYDDHIYPFSSEKSLQKFSDAPHDYLRQMETLRAASVSKAEGTSPQ